SHSGMMLFAMGLGTRAAIAGWLIYVCAHAVVKSSLFFTSGILLHRLRTMSEPALFARGKRLRFTAAVWFLGGCGLAGLPPFATSIAEDLISHAKHGVPEAAPATLFLLSGILTGGEVFRVFMRVFCGWGDQGPSDRSSQVDERPETSEENRVIPFRLFAPAAACILSAITITFIPSLNVLSVAASQRLIGQSGFIAAIYNFPRHMAAVVAPEPELGSMIIHGVAAVVGGFLLALWAVFHKRVPRLIRWPSHLEGSMQWARKLQSGQPADYVVWAMVGVAALGSVL